MKKHDNPFPDRETFDKIYYECLENQKPATPEEKQIFQEEQIKLQHQFESYLALLRRDHFKFAYECGWNAASRQGEKEGIL